MSIRSSCSNDVLWDNVFIEEKAAVPRPVQTWDALANVTSSWWVASGQASWDQNIQDVVVLIYRKLTMPRKRR